MVNVAGERGVGVVDDGAIQPADVAIALQLNVLVYRALSHMAAAAPKESQLAVRPETPVLDPAAEEKVCSRHVKASFNRPKRLESNRIATTRVLRLRRITQFPGRGSAGGINHGRAWLDKPS